VVAISDNLVSPINREAILTDAQAFELQSSRCYFNVHTEANKGEEFADSL
jgi:hypothetical protein